MCGILGVVSNGGEVAEDIRLGLWSLQHRGHESVGISIYNGTDYWVKKRMGRVDFAFHDDAPLKVNGESGIGHVRYSTTGESSIENAQPIEGKFRGFPFGLAHNGNLVKTEKLTEELRNRGYIFSTSTDTEIIASLIHFSEARKFEDALKEALIKVEGTYALTALYKDDVYGVRDPTANRPLVIGYGRGRMLLASESATCDVLGIAFMRDVDPGEFVTLKKNPFSLWSDKISTPVGKLISTQRPCLFEFVYFLRSDSKFYGRRAQIVREEMGRRLWRQSPVEADIVVPVSDSGNDAAIGLAEEAGLPIKFGLFRSHYVGRSFNDPSEERREEYLRIKFNVIPEQVLGKKVVVVDDSIVRSTVIKRVITLLREGGASEIHVRVSSPPYMSPCYYGIDTYRVKDELIATRHNGNVEAIRQEIGADSLHYLSLESLKRAVVEAGTELGESNFCDACFSGNYHIPIE